MTWGPRTSSSALLADRHLLARVVDDPAVDHPQGLADRAMTGAGRRTLLGVRRSIGFGEAVALGHCYARARLELPLDCDGELRAAFGGRDERGEVVVVELFVIYHVDVHRGDADEVGNALCLDRRHRRSGVPLRRVSHVDRPAPGERLHRSVSEAGDVI
jgi:hypothetical protein